MNNIIKKYIGKGGFAMAMLLMATGGVMTSCSDDMMERTNTDKTKVNQLDPNAQLTTSLLQTYGDFSLMDTYRNYITGFTQHFAGGWNVTNYAGAVHHEDDIARRIWDRYYEVAIKNLVDAIHKSEDKANLNAALRIHRVYLLSVLADTYGDIPASEAGLGYISGISNPKYDTVEDLYGWFFTELDACAGIERANLLLVHALTSVLLLIVHDVLDAIHLLVETGVGDGLVVHLEDVTTSCGIDIEVAP